MNTSVRYENDTKVATSGNTVTFYRIGLKLEPEGKKALMSLRKNDKEQLRYALERLIDAGIEKVNAVEDGSDGPNNMITLRCSSDKSISELSDIFDRLPRFGAYPISETLEIHSEYCTFDIEYDDENEEGIMDYIESIDGLNRMGD